MTNAQTADVRRLHGDSHSEGAKTVALLKALIGFKTINPPGDTRSVAEFLKQLFDATGAETEIIVAPNGHAAHFVARLRGNGRKRPVLLAAHTDVVPVEAEGWTVDPFAGIERDGFVYGRGAMDFKGGVAVFARAVLRLAEERVPLDRDVIFLAEADEEQGSYNTEWLARNHWDKIDAEFALNEGGYVFHSADGVVRQVNITTAEKTSVTLRLSAVGPVGHASRPQPYAKTANGKLLSALTRLASHEHPIQVLPVVADYLKGIATVEGAEAASAVTDLLNAQDQLQKQEAEQALAAALPHDADVLRASLRNSWAITVVQAGLKSTVIPGSAHSIVNVRILPTNKASEVLSLVKTLIQDLDVKVEILRPEPTDDEKIEYLNLRTSTGPSSTETELFKSLENHARSLWPGAPVLPTMFEATTDAAAWRIRGVPVYGIYPYPLDRGILAGMHGHDERIAVGSLHQGTAWVYQTLKEVAASS